MKLRAVLNKPLETKPTPTNYSHQEFLDEARARFPSPSEFMEEFLRRFEQLATQDGFQAADHTLDCPQCGAQLLLEVTE